jgi:hypothetical protein
LTPGTVPRASSSAPPEISFQVIEPLVSSLIWSNTAGNVLVLNTSRGGTHDP